MTNPQADVLISGAGPTGLMLALWLTRAGVRVRLIDLKAGPTQESRAIAVQARTLEFYDQLGLGADAQARGCHFDVVRLWANGHMAGGLPIGKGASGLTPYPYMFILTQDQNEAMLIEHLRALGTEVEWETKLLSYTQDADGVTAIIQHGDQTETARVAYLAGCDGAHSIVRHGMDIQFDGAAYAHTFYVADVIATGKISPNDINLAFDDRTFLACFPMPGQNRHRLIGEVPEAVGEHAQFADVQGDIEATGLAKIESVNWFATYRLHHRVASHFRQGRAFLLGDAGHLHSPVGGQGMNTGLGDAVNLAWKLAQVLRGGDPAILDTYETERLPFAQALVKTTDRIFSNVVSASGAAQVARTRVVPAVFPILSRLPSLSRTAFITVSQLRIKYPDSPLSQGRVGALKSGDRLPWVLNGTDSNFAPLQSRQWQMHVYGASQPEVQAWCDQHHLALHVFPFTEAARHAGLTQDALYLIRPDGYIGLAAQHFTPATFDAYVDKWLAQKAPSPVSISETTAG